MRFLWIFAVVLLAVLVWALDQIAVAPLETGEIYPHYSSLRTDPTGAKALYESFAALPEVAVARLYKDRKTMQPGDAIFVLGVDPVPFSALGDQTINEYETLVRDGGRLILAFLPLQSTRPSLDQHPLERRWGLRLASRKTDTGMSLTLEAPDWQEWSHGAIERKFGAGSVVLVPDSFPLSNQGLRDARDAPFISQLTGSAHHIWFDENHFGVVETGSVAKLMRQYRLEGAIAMLAIVAALFLWRSASSFLPARHARSGAAVAGRESIEGLSALLHRGIAEKDLLDACFAEWTKSAKRKDRAVRVEAEIARIGKRDPVEAYRAASGILSEKK
jgi:hypothetical protein